MAQVGSNTDRLQDALMRSRVTQFIDDPKVVEGMSPAEITHAVRLAIRAMVTFVVEEDVKGSRLN